MNDRFISQYVEQLHLKSMRLWFGLLIALLLLLQGCAAFAPPNALVKSTDTRYEYRDRHNSDGIGKFYMGREIAKVMGHRGAMWLERPSRVATESPGLAIAALNLQKTDVVADIGAGTGFFSFRISPLVPEGKVFAVDIQPEMIDILDFLKAENQADNVEPVLADETDPHLPEESVDLALMVDAYHEFEYPYETMTALYGALKPNGRVVLVEYRKENPLIPIKGLHKMSKQQVKREMQAIGLEWEETIETLPQQHIFIFRKPKISSAA